MRSRTDLWLYRLDRLGSPGKLGLLCLAASLLLLLLLILPAVIQMNALTAEITAELNSRAGASVTTNAAADPAQPQSGNRTTAPAALSPEAALRQIFAAAAASGLELERGDYAGITARNAAGNSIQMTLPLKGSYPEIRQFIATVVNDNPAIAIEQIRLSRDSANATELSATVRFVAFQEFQGERP